MMKRVRGAAVSGEIRVREEGNKRGEAPQIQRTPPVGNVAATYRAVSCCSRCGAAANKRTAQLSSDIGTLCLM